MIFLFDYYLKNNNFMKYNFLNVDFFPFIYKNKI